MTKRKEWCHPLIHNGRNYQHLSINCLFCPIKMKVHHSICNWGSFLSCKMTEIRYEIVWYSWNQKIIDLQLLDNIQDIRPLCLERDLLEINIASLSYEILMLHCTWRAIARHSSSQPMMMTHSVIFHEFFIHFPENRLTLINLTFSWFFMNFIGLHMIFKMWFDRSTDCLEN